MATELPHALLSCSECGTGFKLTLKKGRPPSKPVPCPKCKAPITVTEDHIITPGKKSAGSVVGGELRETKPGDVLRQTKLVNPHDIPVDGMMDPKTGEVPLDPPTAEVDIDAAALESEVSAAEADELDVPKSADETPAFGIIKRRKIEPKAEKSSGSLVGINVIKTKGRSARDNVFGQRKTGAAPLARIGARQGPAVPVKADDAELPAPAAKSDTPKLNLDKLRNAMSKLDVSDVSGDEFEQPLSTFEPDIEESEISEPDEDELPSLAEDLSGDDTPAAAADSEPSSDDEDLQTVKAGEPVVVTLDVEDSEGYELGNVDVPFTPVPVQRGSGGIVAAVVVVLIVAAVAYIALF